MLKEYNHIFLITTDKLHFRIKKSPNKHISPNAPNIFTINLDSYTDIQAYGFEIRTSSKNELAYKYCLEVYKDNLLFATLFTGTKFQKKYSLHEFECRIEKRILYTSGFTSLITEFLHVFSAIIFANNEFEIAVDTTHNYFDQMVKLRLNPNIRFKSTLLNTKSTGAHAHTAERDLSILDTIRDGVPEKFSITFGNPEAKPRRKLLSIYFKTPAIKDNDSYLWDFYEKNGIQRGSDVFRFEIRLSSKAFADLKWVPEATNKEASETQLPTLHIDYSRLEDDEYLRHIFFKLLDRSFQWWDDKGNKKRRSTRCDKIIFFPFETITDPSLVTYRKIKRLSKTQVTMDEARIKRRLKNLAKSTIDADADFSGTTYNSLVHEVNHYDMNDWFQNEFGKKRLFKRHPVPNLNLTSPTSATTGSTLPYSNATEACSDPYS